MRSIVSDNVPVFIQNLPGKEHFAIARSFTSRAFLQQPDKAQAGVCELSLSAERLFCRWLYHLTQSALAHVYYSIDRLVVQDYTNSSPWLEAGTSLVQRGETQCACAHPDRYLCIAIRTNRSYEEVMEVYDECQCYCHAEEEESEEIGE